LVPCYQDLRQDRIPTCTKAKFDIWNENETKYTGAYRCIKCWFEGYLDEIATQQPGKGFGGEKFVYGPLHTTVGRFRVTGVASTVCASAFGSLCTGGQMESPLLGLINTEIKFENATIEKFNALAGTTATTAGFYQGPAGPNQFPWIKWDTQGEPPTAPVQ